MLALAGGSSPITLYHLVPLYFDAVSWRELFPASNRPGRLSFLWMRWIRESVSTLLPVAGVGGDVVGARLVHQRGVSGAQATASMVVDITVGTATQLVFVIAGVALLAARKSQDAAAVAWGVMIGVAVFAAAIAIFIRIQHNSMFGVLVGWAHRLAPKSWMSGFAGRAEAIDEAIVATYRRRSALSSSSLLRLIGWATGVGRDLADDAGPRPPLEPGDSFILESLSAGVRGAAFMVPGRFGRARRRSGLVRGAARAARGSGARGLSCQTGPRARARSAGPRGLAMGGGRRLARRQTDKASSTS